VTSTPREPGSKTNVQAARVVAHEVLQRVWRDGAYADRALDAALKRSSLDERDRALAAELVYGTLRRALWLDWLLGHLVKRPLAEVPLPTLTALRLGAYQLLATRIADHGAVSEAVALVRRTHPHQTGFANAVLRELGRRRDAGILPDPRREVEGRRQALAVEGGMPVWLVNRIAEELGDEEAERFVAASNAVAPLWLRVRQRAELDQVVQRLEAHGLEVQRHSVLPRALAVRGGGSPALWPGFAEGDFTVQDAAAQIVGLLAAPTLGSFVLDACAAPGGKAAQLAEAVGPTGRVLAVDLHPGRVRLVTGNAQRLGLDNITAAAADATDAAALRAQAVALGYEEAGLVLVDAPCSGLGTLRRNPELRYRPQSSIAELTALQDRLLDACATLVGEGGALCYAVCTITREEGPERVRAFLARHAGFALETSRDPVLAPFLEPLAGDSAGCVVRTWPHRHDCDGFFAARLVRRA
jgi:16S rRNA (cytosine967-C5)-methyltransferase